MGLSEMKYVLIVVIIFMLGIQPIYSAPNNPHRNPFEKSVHQLAADKTDLSDYPLHTLKLIGTIQHAETLSAVITDPNNHIYYVSMNDTIGLEKAKIARIATDEIELEWIEEGKKHTEQLGL